VAFTPSGPLNAFQRLERLRQLRMRGLAPSSAVVIVTDRAALQRFEELNVPTIEVWPGILDRLDWGPLAGLHVFAVVHWRQQDERMRLFEPLRAAAPAKLHWLATNAQEVRPFRNEAPRILTHSIIIQDGEVWMPSDPDLWSGIYGRV
jgi:hypothetical protein